ncbi:hypothetical protein DRZ77_00095 [Candidatus Woesearchaeota archaeon]|nr:hypothetical protein [Candidatus Woesearchaeota archaeon]RLE41136.1 MAG: hypothetical protein DRZ77_00095 [Candidatus Woesearchaeota archaeon]
MIKDVCKLRECPECGSRNVVCSETREQLICKDCGCIFEPLLGEEEKKLEKIAGIESEEKVKKVKKKSTGTKARRAKKAKRIKKKKR